MQYPGRVIKQGEIDAAIVEALTDQLNRVLVLQAGETIVFDAKAPIFETTMKSAVKLFQSRSADREGVPLKVDGEIGAITWAALFGDDEVPSVSSTDDALLAKVLEFAAAEEARKVREDPLGSNSGKDVQTYLASVGVPAGNSWCAAYVYFCFDQAARGMGRTNPLFRTAGCLAHWNGAPTKGAKRVPSAKALADPSLLAPGMIFIMDHGGGLGHTGLVESVAGGLMTTVEGNSNLGGSREGVGVFRLTRKINSVSKGFIDYRGL